MSALNRLVSTMPKVLTLGMVFLALATTGIAKGPDKVHRIMIRNMKFEPESLQVKVGETVIWINEDLVPHSATAAAGKKAFDSGVIAPGKKFKLKVSRAGEFPYVCAFHPTMSGNLIVKD